MKKARGVLLIVKLVTINAGLEWKGNPFSGLFSFLYYNINAE